VFGRIPVAFNDRTRGERAQHPSREVSQEEGPAKVVLRVRHRFVREKSPDGSYPPGYAFSLSVSCSQPRSLTIAQLPN